MTLSDVGSNTLFHFFYSPRLRRLGAKQRPMNVLESEAARSAHYNLVAVFLPFQDGTGSYTEFLPNLLRN
jgi:hypothetical protein